MSPYILGTSSIVLSITKHVSVFTVYVKLSLYTNGSTIVYHDPVYLYTILAFDPLILSLFTVGYRADV